MIVEGEALLNPALAQLCGVSVEDRAEHVAGDVVPDIGGKALRAFGSCIGTVDGPFLPLALEGSEVIGAIWEKPIATVREASRGLAVGVALLDPPAGLVRPLVVDLGGTLPLSVDDKDSPHVRIAALSDGSRTAIGVYNEDTSGARTVTIHLGDIAPRGARIATNIHRGVQHEVRDSLRVELPGETWNFVLLEPFDEAPRLPPCGSPVSGYAYAARGQRQREQQEAQERVH